MGSGERDQRVAFPAFSFLEGLWYTQTIRLNYPHMSKFIKTAFVLSGLILLGAGCGRQAAQQDAPATSSVTQSVEVKAPEGTKATVNVISKEAVMEYREGVFNPATLRVLAGTKVTFVNKGTKEVWPASGRHPTHDICPGFDALKTLKSGETYSYLFNKPTECPFHNHVAPAEKGKIEVKTE